jgi:probable F420-dependent oxidoreductase
VKFGLCLPQTEYVDLQRDVTMVAREAEAAGFDSLWVYERVLFPLEPADGMYGVPGLPWLDEYRFTAEPLIVLTMAATVTERVRLGTCVLVAGLHSSSALARSLATLDQATGGGRLVTGLGGGWSSDEFRAGGADFDHRGRALDETLDALDALWGPNPVSYQDSRMSIHNALISPKPVARIPVLIGGGNSRTALDRIARRADGWMPTGLPTPVLAQQWQAIRDLAAGHGRNGEDLTMVPLLHLSVTDTPAGADRAPFQGSIAQIVSDIAEVAALGADEAILSIHGVSSGKELLEKATAVLRAVA